MTWYYNISDNGSSMDIYEDDPAFTGKVTTLKNDGSGFRIPDDILEIMKEVYLSETTPGDAPVHSERAVCINVDMQSGDIQEGTPDGQ